MGQGMPGEVARNVRGGIVEKIGETPSSSARPDGNQTALHHTPGRRYFLWLRAESHFCPSGDRTPAESSGPRLLSFAELCSVPLDSRGRNRKTSAGLLAGMERRKDILGCLLEIAFHPGVQLHAGDSKGRTRQLAAAIGARAHDFRCSAGDLAERRNGFDDHPALCIESLRCAVENIFDFISRTKF